MGRGENAQRDPGGAYTIAVPETLSNNPLCQTLARARVDQNVSRDALSEATGYGKTTIRHWENGTQDPFGKVQAWAQSLGFEIVLVSSVANMKAENQRLRDFVDSITDALGPYPDLNGHPIVRAAYEALRSQNCDGEKS